MCDKNTGAGPCVPERVVGLKVKYIGEDLVAMRVGKIYDVISIEKGWYRIMTELGETYLFPPHLFEVVEDD